MTLRGPLRFELSFNFFDLFANVISFHEKLSQKLVKKVENFDKLLCDWRHSSAVDHMHEAMDSSLQQAQNEVMSELRQ